MPAQNRFHHQAYPTQPAVRPVKKLLSVTDSDGFDFSRLHTYLGVSRVILVHGTFMGDDPLGMADVLNAYSGAFPSFAEHLKGLADSIKRNTRPLTMKVTDDIGNYTFDYQQRFRALSGDFPFVYLLDPGWSGQNNHLARADLAVRLFHHLHSLELSRNDRVLLWGHSHAGNAFALLSNLLANDPVATGRFFDAAGAQEGLHWSESQTLLEVSPSPHPLAKNLLIAAFGTPVRYGWDTSGYRSLLHILHHRDSPDQTERRDVQTQPLFPPQLPHEVLSARYGDWVQAFGIAGTDSSSPPPSAEDCRRLGDFLEHSLPKPALDTEMRLILPESLRLLCARWKTGTRCHSDGHNILVEYEPSGLTSLNLPIEKSLMGHGVATTVAWLPAHLKLVIEMLLQYDDF